MSSETITRNDLKNILDTIGLIKKDIIGEIRMYSGSSAPTGWLICDGSAVSRTTYSDLFNIIGTTYGSGDGSTTFNLPNMKGRFPLGVGSVDAGDSSAESYWGGTAAGAVNAPLGQRAGEAWDTLSISKIPSHTHAIHTYAASQSGWQGRYPITYDANGLDPASYAWISSGTLVADVPNITYTGEGQAHNNMPPFIAVNFIIYAG